MYCFCSYSTQSQPNLQHSERKKKSLKKYSDQSTKNSPSNQLSPSSSFSKTTTKPPPNPVKQFKPNQDYFPIFHNQFQKKIIQPSVNTTPKKQSPSVNFKYSTPVKKNSEKMLKKIQPQIQPQIRGINTNVREKKNNKIVVKRAVSYEDSECES